jgi:hypothetical protein
MEHNTYPIGTILFNFLFLMVAMATEGYVLSKRLRYDKRISAFYAIAINLFSSILGWLIFFIVEPRLSLPLKFELFNYVFFNRLDFSPGNITLISTIGLVVFIGTFLVKYLFLVLFTLSMRDPLFQKKQSAPVDPRDTRRVYRGNRQNTNVVTATLIANSLSYSAILLIVIIRTAVIN